MIYRKNPKPQSHHSQSTTMIISSSSSSSSSPSSLSSSSSELLSVVILSAHWEQNEGNILLMDSSFAYCSSLRNMCVALGSVTFPRLVSDRSAYTVRFHLCPPKILTSSRQPTAIKQKTCALHLEFEKKEGIALPH
ncbi:hypothetical protein TNIN_199741 [Trichonephila inaurata madagascariensis]|uniref:Uncharacterized protein n=1 Tax=Trichonephila inaurata madagascariensis TaxID=2747483 RepID=A0A8X6XDV3_9ARAC|nr:hypothetical protein TNIN_199741 [Trichonephila inaurata madagascariensis]